MIEAKLSGIPDLREALAGIVPKLRVRALRLALAAGARVVQAQVRRNTPVLNLENPSNAHAYRRGWRKPGVLRKAISVRTSKMARQRGDVGVFVNVRPAKGLARGRKSYGDPFYWRWVEFGHRFVSRYKGKYTDYRLRGRGRLTGLAKRRRAATQRIPGVFFMRSGSAALPRAMEVFAQKIIPAIAKLNRPRAPAP